MAKTTAANGMNGPQPEGTIHLTLQGKGGVGKSLVASVLAQYFTDNGREVRCIDTDPVNRTFAQYAALGADRLNLRDEHNRIDQRAFDILMERFLTEEAATFVVDSGASTFLPLWHYLLENNALDYLRQHGRKVYVHTIITGGQALLDTLNGFHELAQTTQERNIVVWVNEYFGRVEAEGKKFSEMTAYRENAEKVCGAVIFSKRNQDTFGRDVEDMIASKLTFREAIVEAKLPIMAKQRLKVVQRDLFEQLDRVSDGLVDTNPAAALFTPACKPEGEKRVMSPKEIRLALSVLDARERLIFRMAVFDGMRPGEILAIRLGNISGQSVLIDQRVYYGNIDTPKGRKGKRTSRTVGLSPGTVAELELWRTLLLKQERNSFLFPTENETPLRLDNLRKRHMLPKLEEVGLEWATFQVLRRTNASLSREANIDDKVAADQRGHGLGVSLETYSISSVKQKIDAAKRLETEVIQ